MHILSITNLKISGLPSPTDEADLVTRRDIMVNTFLNRLNRAAIKDIAKTDIQTARVIKVPGQTGHVLQIKLISEVIKDRIYRNRTQLKMFRADDEKIFINEDLLKVDSIKFSNARKAQREGRWESVWTFHGKVYARNSESTRPTCLSDS